MAEAKKPANWLVPASEVWEQKFGKGTFPWGRFGSALKGLAPHYAPEVIADHLEEYLNRTDVRYLNIPAFASTFLAWGGGGELVGDDGVLRG